MKIQLVGEAQGVYDQMSGAALMDSSQAVRKTLGAIATVVLAILSIPGLWDDVATWTTWLGWVP